MQGRKQRRRRRRIRRRRRRRRIQRTKRDKVNSQYITVHNAFLYDYLTVPSNIIVQGSISPQAVSLVKSTPSTPWIQSNPTDTASPADNGAFGDPRLLDDSGVADIRMEETGVVH